MTFFTPRTTLAIFAGLACAWIIPPAAAAVVDCPVYNKGLLESMQESDAIVEIVSEQQGTFKKEGNTIFNDFSVGKVLAGSKVEPSQVLTVGFPVQDGRVTSNLQARTGVRYDTHTFLWAQGVDEGFAFFMLRKIKKHYCLVGNVSYLRNLALIEPSRLLLDYWAFKYLPPADQTLGVLTAMLQLAYTQPDIASVSFPLPSVLYDWDQVKQHIDYTRAGPLMEKAVPLLAKTPRGSISMAVSFLMTDEQKRAIITTLLTEYDTYMAEQKRYCIPEREPKGSELEMTADQHLWMEKCTPPTSHREMAHIMGSKTDPNLSALIIEEAREFIIPDVEPDPPPPPAQ